LFGLILAGGRGERLRPLTDNIPKPMAPLNGRPVLEYQVEWLRDGGVTEVVFLVGYRWQSVRDHFQDGQAFGIRAHYSVEDSPLGRGGAVKKGLSVVTDATAPIVVTNGDTITEEPLMTLLRRHDERTKKNPSHLVTMMVVPFVSPYSVIQMDHQDQILDFEDSPHLPYWVNAGLYVMEGRVADDFPEIGDHETHTFPGLARRSRILGVKSNKFWIGIDSFDDLHRAENYLNSRGR